MHVEYWAILSKLQGVSRVLRILVGSTADSSQHHYRHCGDMTTTRSTTTTSPTILEIQVCFKKASHGVHVTLFESLQRNRVGVSLWITHL